jgi:hypothetical protein
VNNLFHHIISLVITPRSHQIGPIVFPARPCDRQEHNALPQRKDLVRLIPIEREETTRAEIEGPLSRLDLEMA